MLHFFGVSHHLEVTRTGATHMSAALESLLLTFTGTIFAPCSGALFSENVYKNKRIATHWGARAGSAPLDPPMGIKPWPPVWKAG